MTGETQLGTEGGILSDGGRGLPVARMLGAALFWANTGDTRVVFLHSLILLVLPYIGAPKPPGGRAKAKRRKA